VLAAKPTRPRRKKISGCKWCANVSLQSSVRCAVAYEETEDRASIAVASKIYVPPQYTCHHRPLADPSSPVRQWCARGLSNSASARPTLLQLGGKPTSAAGVRPITRPDDRLQFTMITGR
jgi:hypothetical protein